MRFRIFTLVIFFLIFSKSMMLITRTFLILQVEIIALHTLDKLLILKKL